MNDQIRQQNIRAFISYSHDSTQHSEHVLILAELPEARRIAEKGVELADRCEDVDNAVENAVRRRAWLAHVLHQIGDKEKSYELFLTAERTLQGKRKREIRLKSIAGIQFCSLLLALDRIDEVEARAKEIEALGRETGAPLDIALGLLMRAQAILRRTEMSTAYGDRVRDLISRSDVFLRFAAQQDFYPPLLFARAELHANNHDFRAVEKDIAEAEECSRRSGIKLYLADALIYRARLLNDAAALAQARRLIEEWGYWRWKEDLEKMDERLSPADPLR